MATRKRNCGWSEGQADSNMCHVSIISTRYSQQVFTQGPSIRHTVLVDTLYIFYPQDWMKMQAPL